MSNESREATREELLQEVEKRGLKIQALLEDITSTRDSNADLRVELTYLTNHVQNLQRSNEVTQSDSAPEAD